MKMDSPYHSGEDDETILTSLDWTIFEKIALTESVIANGRLLLPAGVSKHFHMIEINRRFYNATKKRVETRVLWDKLNEHIDLSIADRMLRCPFPNEETEFSLPDNDFKQLISEKKSLSAQDKIMDDESHDSGSGRETPPTLPIAQRGAVVASSVANSSSSKRKYSSSFSDAGFETGTGRKSSSSTPKSAGGSASKAKRRIFEAAEAK